LIELEAINALVRQAKVSGEVFEPAAAEPVRVDFERKLITLAEIDGVIGRRSCG